MMMYFDQDGGYGSEDGLLYANTGDWSPEDWYVIETVQDAHRQSAASAIKHGYIKNWLMENGYDRIWSWR